MYSFRNRLPHLEHGETPSILRIIFGAVALLLFLWTPFIASGPGPKEFHLTFFGLWNGAGVDMAHLWKVKFPLIVAVAYGWAELALYVLTYPFANSFSSLFYPDERLLPPPDYPRAKRYSQQRRWDEALAVYRGIVEHHPQEREAYREGIRMAFLAGRPRDALRLCSRSLRRIPCGKWRLEMEKYYRHERDQFLQKR